MVQTSDNKLYIQELEEQLKVNKVVLYNFQKLPPSHKKQYVDWLNSATKKTSKYLNHNSLLLITFLNHLVKIFV